ncbi:hypothetical protein [Rhizobium redzepovicii]
MTVRTGKVYIDATPQVIIDFLSNPANLLKITPGRDQAEVADDGTFAIAKHGARAATSVSLQIDKDRNRMEWATEDRSYSGWLEAVSSDKGSEVTVQISTTETVSDQSHGKAGEDRFQHSLELLRRGIR